MNQDEIQDAIDDVKTWIGRSPASIDERHYERNAAEAFDSLVSQIRTLTAERDLLRTQLTSMQTSSVEEVEELRKKSERFVLGNHEAWAIIDKSLDVARTFAARNAWNEKCLAEAKAEAIIAREEAEESNAELVGLLKWLANLPGVDAYFSVCSHGNVPRIMEIITATEVYSCYNPNRKPAASSE